MFTQFFYRKIPVSTHFNQVHQNKINCSLPEKRFSLVLFTLLFPLIANADPVHLEFGSGMKNNSCTISLVNPVESGNCPGIAYTFEAVADETCESASYFWSVYLSGQGPVNLPDLDDQETTFTFRPERCGIYEISLNIACEGGQAAPECALRFEVTDDEPPVLLRCPTGGSVPGCTPEDIFPALTGLPLSTGKGVEISVEEFEREGGKVEDNCGPVTITYRDFVSGKCEFGITRIFFINDQCKNVNEECFQQFFVDPPTPILTCPKDITILCDEDLSPERTGFAEAVDPCSPLTLVSLSFRDSKPVIDCKYSYSFNRTWTAVSFCGAVTTCIQTITVKDNRAPVIEGIPSDTTVTCDDIPEIPDVVITDNCDPDPKSTFDEFIHKGDCPNSFLISRVWRVEDACGNRRVSKQLITVIDTAAPVADLEENEADVTLDAYDREAFVQALEFEPTFTDNCSGPDGITVTLISDEEIEGMDCPDACIRIRVWTAADECGNVSRAFSQTITIEHHEKPVPDQEPGEADAILRCDDDEGLSKALAFKPTFSVNCNQGHVLSTFLIVDQITTGTDCSENYTRERIWSLYDGCQTVDSVYTQTIAVIDNRSPDIEGVPEDITVDCDAVPEIPDVIAVDNCSLNPVLTFDENIHYDDCPNTFTIARVWRAEDPCGNRRVKKQVITVNITEAGCPELFSCQEEKLPGIALNQTSGRGAEATKTSPEQLPTTETGKNVLKKEGDLKQITLFPNPATENLRVSLVTERPGKVTLTIHNVHGQIVRRMESELVAGENTLILDLNALGAGTYYLLCRSGEDTTIERFVKISG